jgi:hypothetical protein
MPTGIVGTAAREHATQQMPYLRKTFNHDDLGFTSALTVVMPAPLPSGAIVQYIQVVIHEAFNDGSSNGLKVGTASNDDAFVETGDVDMTATGATYIWRGGDVEVAADTQVYVQFVAGSDGGSQGSATVTVVYVPNNDQ